MRALLSFTFVVLSFAGAPSGQRCKCLPAAAHETTRDGANENIVIVDKQPYPRIAGIVRDVNNQAMGDVLVEVFDNPEHLVSPYPDGMTKPKPKLRLAACIAGDSGEFCFANIPA